MAKSKRTRELDVSPKVRAAVNKRQEIDGYPNCIFGHTPKYLDMAHIRSRQQGGRGVEENIVGLCRGCHRQLDHTGERQTMLRRIREYMKHIYGEDWSEDNYVYERGY